MDDLFSKIEQLYKSLLSLKQDTAKNAFVPAIKPQVNSFKLPKPSIKTTTKIPGGLPPPSKKNPIKVAEQLKRPQPGKVSMEVLKVEDNGQWTLSKAVPAISAIADTAISPRGANGTKIEGQQAKLNTATSARLARQTTPVHADQHGWKEHNSPAGQNLIHGLKLHEATPISSGGKQGAAFANSDNHAHTAVVKNSMDHQNREERGHTVNNFNSARREVMYHNLARDYFGLGHHVPETAGFTKNGADWSAQRKVDDVSHPDIRHHPENNISFVNSNHEDVVRRLNNQGTLDKLAVMDNIMGHHDRHSNNVMIDNKGDNMHLIDNGTAFDYDNLDAHPIPKYRELASHDMMRGEGDHNNENLHPAAKEWLQSLSPDKAKEMLARHGHDENSPATKGFMKRLTGMQEKVAKGNPKGITFNHTLLSNRKKD